VTFQATSSETGNPAVKARIYVGHYEARVSPIADTDPATNAPSTARANNLDEKATFAPGTYEFIATAPGYGAVRYQDEQDADPVNATDCNTAGAAAARFVRVAEVQAFRANSTAQGWQIRLED
jgi:extracellular elastinolytic metalloproteinase